VKKKKEARKGKEGGGEGNRRTPSSLPRLSFSPLDSEKGRKGKRKIFGGEGREGRRGGGA